MRPSIRMRLTLWYTALMTVAIIAFSAGVLMIHARWSRAQFDAELSNLAAAATRVLDEEFAESRNLRRAFAETRESLNVPDRAMAVLDDHAVPVAAHWHGFDYRLSPASIVETRRRFTTVTQAGVAWRVLTAPAHLEAGDFTVFVAGPLEQIARQQSLLLRIVLVAGPLMVLTTGLVAWWVASAALRPVTTMAAQAEAITARSPAWRLNGDSDGDELGQLARAFNRLLTRLGDASQAQRQFMADASHELRTPVSVIQTATEVTLDHTERPPDEYREALTIINEQSTRLSRMVEDMFVLARADAGNVEVAMQRLYIDDIVAECVRGATIVAAARSVSLNAQLDADVALTGNDDLLRQLVTNLLDNAIQHTPAGGAIDVRVTRTRREVVVSVSDTGPGVPASERDRIFERFVRLDPARSATSGAGLGLSIARWIAEQHNGSIEVDANVVGGAVFQLKLPNDERSMKTGQPGRSERT